MEDFAKQRFTKSPPQVSNDITTEEEDLMSKEAFNDNFAENLGITDNDIATRGSLNFEARLLSAESGSTSLPSMSFAASAVYSREGNDLVMTLNGDTVVVENYFATPTPPTLTTMDGAILSPSLIASFLPHDVGQDFYASSLLNKLLGNGQSLDNDTIAVLEGLEGSVLVIRNGKATTLQQGDQIFQGDQISTASASSASLIFSDGTQFKIGGEARIALDSFSFESSTSQGLQLLSILSGAFSYVSGLVAKNDPANVQLRTPFGEIGIRGTKIVGEVDTEKAEASVTLLEGRAIYTSPQGEVYEINQGFDTLRIKDGGEKVRETTISAERVAKEYDVFENVGEVSNFLHQAPATQQNQDQGGAGAEADLPLPDISYSQAQAEVRALTIANVDIALEGNSINEVFLEQVVSIELQRAELLRDILGKDQTEDESLIASVGKIDNSDVLRGGDDIYHIVLADLADSVFVGDGAGGSATYDTLNFILPQQYANTIQLNFFKGAYNDNGGGASTAQTFSFYVDENGRTVLKDFAFGGSELAKGSLNNSGSESPSGDLDDLRIEAIFDSNGDGVTEIFNLILLNYFPLEQSHVLPTYSIAINGGAVKALESYNQEIIDLF